MLDASRKCLCQFCDEFHATPRLNYGCCRPVVKNPALDERTCAKQLDANLATAVRERMLGCIRYELVDDHSQSAAIIRLELQGGSRKHKPRFQMIELGTAD